MSNDFIVFSDPHFRDDQPRCRTDNFWDTQIEKMKWLKNISYKYNDPIIICCGDYFDHWKPSPQLLSACIKYMPFCFVIPGQHDLPNHNINLIKKSGLYTLELAKKVYILNKPNTDSFITLYPFPWGEKLVPLKKSKTAHNVAIVHKLIEHSKSDETINSIYKKLKGYDVIFSGDNHQSFEDCSLYPKQMLVNLGSFSRQKADQINHTPSICLYHAQDKKIERIFVPINKNVISRDHLDKVTNKDNRLDNYIEKMKKDTKISLDYRKNTENYFNNNRTTKAVKHMVWESIDG